MNSMKKTIFVLLLALAGHAAAFAQGVTPRIVGGVQSGAADYPWMVALLDASEPDAYRALNCGGTLIRPNVVLTAAHCVADLDKLSDMDVAVGVYDLSEVKPKQRIPLSRIIIHPGYNPETIDNDIALLRLARSSAAPTVTLVDPVTMNSLDGYMLLTVVGWGADADPDGPVGPRFPYTLWEAEVDYIVPDICSDLLEGELSGNMLCAGVVTNGAVTGGRDSCVGDSGGPLLYEYNSSLYQVGIVSWGLGCALPDKPGVYTRVANYGDWINRALGVSGNSSSGHGGGSLGYAILALLMAGTVRRRRRQ